MYPSDWPSCPGCGRPAMDGHITCGSASCDEGGARAARAAAPAARLPVHYVFASGSPSEPNPCPILGASTPGAYRTTLYTTHVTCFWCRDEIRRRAEAKTEVR